MNFEKFSPGPWRAQSRGLSDNALIITDANGEEIACLVEGPRRGYTPEDKMAQANAECMAASLRLLRELKSAIFYIENYGGEVTSSFASGGNLKDIKALIAQAEGSQ